MITPTSTIKIKSELHKFSNPSKAQTLRRFFKTGKGEYAEGDVFLGVTVPESRKIAQAHLSTPPKELEELLMSKIHEERLVALIILVERFKKSSPSEQKVI